jgi:hypothetical protein
MLYTYKHTKTLMCDQANYLSVTVDILVVKKMV